jgi:hypothetical protein
MSCRNLGSGIIKLQHALTNKGIADMEILAGEI